MTERSESMADGQARPANPVREPEFVRQVLIVVGVVGTTAALTAVFVLASDLFFLFFAAVLLAILLRAAAEAVGRWTNLGPGWGLGIVAVALVAVAAFGVYLIGTTAGAQFDHLAATLPKSADQARTYLARFSWGDEALRRLPAAEDLLTGGKGNAASTAARFFSTTFGVLGNLLVLGVVTLYLAATPDTYRKGLLLLVPAARRPRADQVLTTIGTQLRGWLVGRLVAMAAVGVVTGVGLWLVGVPQFLVLAILAAALTAVPFIGPIAASVPGILAALMQGPATAGWAVGVYVLAQLIENYLITPLVQQRLVSMPPVLTIASVTLVGALFGVAGLIVAAPLAVALLAAVKMLYVEDVLGDDLRVRGESEAG